MMVVGRHVIREEEDKDLGCQRKTGWLPLLQLLPSQDGVGQCDGEFCMSTGLVCGNALGDTYFLFHQREVLLFPEATAPASLEKSSSLEEIVYKG